MRLSDSTFGLYKIFFYLFVFVQKSIILAFTPPIRITHTTAILLRDSCAIYDLPPTLPLYAIHHTILVMTISCKGYFDVEFPKMNEARLSHLPFWGPSEFFFIINSTAVGLTRMKRSSFGLRVRVNPWVNLGERFIRVNPTNV